MLPNQETIGVVLEPADIPTVTDAFNTARKYESDVPLKGSDTLRLPAADDNGLTPLDETKALEIETYATIGLSVLTRRMKADNYEYIARLTSGIPANLEIANQLEAKIQELESHAITLQGLQRAIEANLLLSEQSRVSAAG